MRVLLDTQALIWFAEGNPRLSSQARHTIERGETEAYYSTASIWEIAIKVSLGKLRLHRPLDSAFREMLLEQGFEELPISFTHAAEVAMLPRHHADPFDRLLIAQARVEHLTAVSSDGAWDDYGVSRIW